VIRLLALMILASTLALPASAGTAFPRLLADAPEPTHADKLATFGQFVGSWVWDGVQYRDDGTRATDKGEIHFHWILNGEAIQDVWFETEGNDDGPKTLGTTLRFYDPKTDTWTITWIHPRVSAVKVMTGHKSGNDIVIDGTSSKGVQYRWIFSEITKDAFRWHAESLIGGQWRITEDLRVKRMPVKE
jgi:hypothetical protein